MGKTPLIGSRTSSHAAYTGIVRRTAVNISGFFSARKRRSAASGATASCIVPLSAPQIPTVNSSRPTTFRVVGGPGSTAPGRSR